MCGNRANDKRKLSSLRLNVYSSEKGPDSRVIVCVCACEQMNEFEIGWQIGGVGVGLCLVQALYVDTGERVVLVHVFIVTSFHTKRGLFSG